MTFNFLKMDAREQKMLSWALVILFVASPLRFFFDASYVAVEKSYEPS